MIISLNKNMKNIQLSGIREFNALAEKENAELFLTLGEPDFQTPEVVKTACVEALNANKTHYGPNTGVKELKDEILRFEKKKNGLDYAQNELMVTNGSTEALAAALMAVLNVGDEVIIPTPAFSLYEMVIAYTGAVVVRMDTTENDFQISEKMLKDSISNKTKVIILTSPNNPTGVIYNEKTLNTIKDLVKGKNIFVICDECYNQLIYTETKPKSFCNFSDMRSQIIICQSFSKPYAMTGWRLGYLLAPAYVTAEAAKLHQFMTVSANTFVQHAGVTALNFDPSDFVKDYKDRRDFVYQKLLEIGFDVIKPEGAFYIFPSIKKFGMTSLEFCTKFLMQQKVAIIPGSAFGSEGNIRISFCVNIEVLHQALNRLEKFVNSL